MASGKRPQQGRQLRAAYRLAYFLALALLLVCTALLQLDRQTRIAPQLSRLVPYPFQSQALELNVAEAIRIKNPDAFRMAVDLIERRPIPADTLYMASLAAVEAGEDDVADATMGLAASRGWRVTLPNLLALQGAFMGEDWEGSVLRLAALVRMNSTPEVTSQGLSLIAEREAGREAIANYAATDPKFAFFALRSSIDSVKLTSAVDIIDRIRAKGGEFTCPDLAWVTGALLRRAAADEANNLWPKRCVIADPADTSLNRKSLAAGSADPFGWQWKKSPGLSRTFRGGEVEIRNSDPLEKTFATRVITLDPGNYVVRWERGEGATGSDVMAQEVEVSLAVSCYPRSAMADLVFRGTEYELTISEACPVQQLDLRMGRGKAVLRNFVIVQSTR